MSSSVRWGTKAILVVVSCWLSLLAACAPNQYEQRGGGKSPLSQAAMFVRLQDVAFPLLVASADWCPFDQGATYGFLLQDHATAATPVEKQSAPRPTVSYVHPHLPAGTNGLLQGDQLLLASERDVASLPPEEVMSLVRRLTRARIQPLQLVVARGGARRSLTMWAVPACEFTMHVIETDEINGITDGRRIGVTSGAMRFLPSDDELAWVVAHEIAHNVLSHVQDAKLKLMLNSFLHATVGGSNGTVKPIAQQSLEAQADYVGAYLMDRAGYDLSAVRRLWRRIEAMASEPAAPRAGTMRSHPTTAERMSAFEITLKEIEQKHARGEPLLPALEGSPQ